LAIVDSLYTLKKFWVVLTQLWVKYGVYTPINIGLKLEFKNVTQWLDLSIFDPNLREIIKHDFYKENISTIKRMAFIVTGLNSIKYGERWRTKKTI